MIERIDIYLYTYLETNKPEFPEARMYFYEIETTNPKSLYSDSGGCIQHPNPVIADDEGRFPKLFIEKPYSVVIADKIGQVVFRDDYE